MADTICPQCGGTTGILTRGQLCNGCDLRFRMQEDASLAQIHAVHAQSRADEEAAEREEEEQEEERLSERASFLNGYPDDVERLLSSANGDDKLITSIAQMAEVFKNIDEAEWLWLGGRTPFEAAVTYKRLRSTLSPKMAEWWKDRSKLSPSPVPMLKVIARSLLYIDFEAVKIAAKELPDAIKGVQEEINTQNAAIAELHTAVEKADTRLAKASESVRRCEELLSKAQQQQDCPIDDEEIKKESRRQLTVYKGIGSIIAIVFGGLLLVTNMVSKEGKPLGGLICSLPFLACGAYLGIAVLRMKRMSPEEFNQRVASKSMENTQKLLNSRKESLEKVQHKLAKAQEYRDGVSQERLSMQKQIEASGEKMAGLNQRIQTITEEKMRGRIDPVMKAIVDG